MTVQVKLTGASSAANTDWNAIDWRKVESGVNQIQARIAKAVKEKRWGKVKSLQWLLTHSYYGKLIAIKRVTSNKGKTTPGVDGETWKTDNQKRLAIAKLKSKGYAPLPLRRVYIPKKNNKTRPLSIPTMLDRAMQALYLLGLEPVAESVADVNSYGFRKRRCCADAIEQCFNALGKNRSAQFVLEGDIKSCFDNINHDWLSQNIPMDKKILSKWLKSGYVFKQRFYHSKSGTPQGGIISPALLTITLAGMEPTIIKKYKKNGAKVNVIVYADDFVITGTTAELLDTKVKPCIEEFLKERGLELSKEKTLITHINDGFDFLGHNIRKYDNKLLIKPSKSNIKEIKSKLRYKCRYYSGNSAATLIKVLNLVIVGWANYFRHVVSKEIFNELDNYIFKLIWKWLRKEHSNKSKRWIYDKYFKADPKGRIRFGAQDKDKNRIYLKFASDIPIVRFVKIRGETNYFLPECREYFRQRSKYMFSIRSANQANKSLNAGYSD